MTRRVLVAVLRHPERGRVLVLRSDRTWRLPRVVVPDDVRYPRADAIVASFERRLGTRPWLLRRLVSDMAGAAEYVELELLDRGWKPPAHARWVNRAELDRVPRWDGAHRALLDGYLAALERDEIPAARPAWARRGWAGEVRAWIEREAGRLGLGVVDVEQVKQWSISSVLRVRTSGPTLFLKASARLPLFAEEAIVTRRLASRFPGYAPMPLALDPARCWLLLEEFEEPLGWNETTETRAELFRRFAGLQRQSAGLVDELLADGCIDRRLGVLAGQIDGLVASPVATRQLADDEVAQLRALAPKLADLCGRLEACRLPPTLVHGDLHAGNVARIGGELAYYDWTDACIAHPFTDLHSLGWEEDERTRRALLDAYLEPWRGAVPDELLEEAVTLARAVVPLHHAVSYWQIVANVEPQLSSELDVTHVYLREALEQACALDGSGPTRGRGTPSARPRSS